MIIKTNFYQNCKSKRNVLFTANRPNFEYYILSNNSKLSNAQNGPINESFLHRNGFYSEFGRYSIKPPANRLETIEKIIRILLAIFAPNLRGFRRNSLLSAAVSTNAATHLCCRSFSESVPRKSLRVNRMSSKRFVVNDPVCGVGNEIVLIHSTISMRSDEG